MRNYIVALALSLAAVAPLSAQNPIITHIYTADPTARVHNGKLYLYPSCDRIPDSEDPDKVDFCMPGYHAFSLEGGSTWRDHGWVLRENEVPWGAKDLDAMWAPDCVEKGGKFYYFYPAKPADGKGFRRIGVGVSDDPAGPFTWEENYIEGVSGIDPGLLVDDDPNESAYLFFGGGSDLFVAPLSDDMRSITAKPIKVEHLPAGYKEASFPIKINGTYYFTFAHGFKGEGYTIGYATSDKPMGPYTYQGKIMDNIGDGTNHHSIVNYKGRWILFYHSWQVSGMNKLRSVCADYMTLNYDGKIQPIMTTIPKVRPTLRGIGAPMAGDTIQVDRYNTIDRAQTAFVTGGEPAGWMVCEAANGSYVIFNDVDFGDGGATTMQARIACGQRTGSIEVRSGGPNGELIAEFPITNSGGWDSWKSVTAPISEGISGMHNLCVVFRNISGSTKTANLNWLLIEK